jgi:hypothetical protein
MSNTSMKRIHSVTIVKRIDESPDTSYLGDYAATPTSEFSIDRKSYSSPPWELRYFNPSSNYVDANGKALPGNSPEEIRKYVSEDYRRMEAYNNGFWHYVGLYAVASVQLTKDGPFQEIQSGGLWGIESDSGDDNFASVENEELSQLREQLHALGFSKRAISAAFKTITRKER